MNETMNLIYDIWETIATCAAGCSCRIWGPNGGGGVSPKLIVQDIPESS